MKKLASLRFSDTAVLALLVAGAAASVAACSKEEPKKSAWSCTKDAVPMGETVRCTSAALTSDGPPIDTTGSTGTTSGGTGTTDGTSDGTTADTTTGASDGTSADGTSSSSGGTTTDGASDGTSAGGDGSTTYECGADSASEDCPPADAGSDGTSGDGTSTGGTGTTDGTSDGANGNGNGNGGGNGTGGGGGSSSSGGSSSGAVGSDGASGGSHPGECSYVPELPYCGGAEGGTSSSGGTECTRPNCDAPGQTKDGTSDGATGSSSGSSGATGSSSGSSGSSGETTGGASSSSSSGGSGKGKGKTWHCTKDKKGNKSCTSVPTCAPGTHPAPCGACVPDADGSVNDCVAPKDGGCWVTGGGFVVAPNALTGTAADGHDNFGGNAKPMKDGTVKGHWNHVDHGTGNHAKGRPSYIFCRKVDEPGPGGPGAKKGFVMNQVYFGGPAEWRDAATGAWGEGYWFDVVAKDHGEPGSVPKAKNGFMPDTYHFTIRLVSDPANNASGTVVYETAGELQGGNIQMHPPNGGHPATQSTLPTWVSLEP